MFESSLGRFYSMFSASFATAIVIVTLGATSAITSFAFDRAPAQAVDLQETLPFNSVKEDNRTSEAPQGVSSVSSVSSITATFDKAPQVRVRPDISSRAYMVVDPHTNTEILSHNADVAFPPASLAKIMTAYVVADYIYNKKIDLQAEVPVSVKAFNTPGSKMFIQPNRAVTVDQLLFGLIIVSGNDAAVALAEYISGNEDDFAVLMNQYAQSLGMTNCFFTNSNGLPDPDMLCSINDIMILCKELITKYPSFYKRYFGLKQYTYNDITQRNRNTLIFRANDEIDGIKTGNTRAAGYNLIASGVRGYRLIAGVMGAGGIEVRTAEVSKLLNHAYVYYNRYLHYRQEEKIADIRVRKGSKGSLAVGLAEDLYTTIPFVLRESFSVTIDAPRVMRAPISKGEQLGELILEFEGGEVLKRPLIALENIPSAGFLGSTFDEIMIFLGF